MRDEIEEILQFWFGDLEDGFADVSRDELWWASTVEMDQTIERLFSSRVELALNGMLDSWADHPRGRLALIILLDQFTRVVYRGKAQAFSGDASALDLCKKGLLLEHDQALETAERIFFCLPLEHAEDLASQNHAVEYFDQMLSDAALEHKSKLRATANFAYQHREIIMSFGRFPHRNQALKRVSTPQELAFLNNGHNRWGQ